MQNSNSDIIKSSISTPGKLMLMGEHAVVYGRPCIVTAVDQRMNVIVELLDQPIFRLEAAELNVINYQKPLLDLGKGDIPKEVKFAEIAVRNFVNKFKTSIGIKIKTHANFSGNFGFGSSSAVSVGVIKVLSEVMQIKLSDKELFDISYKTVLDVQGKGSGFDVAASIYGGTLYFQKSGGIIESLPADEMSLIVGYSGIKADTVSMINLVSEKMKNYKEGVEKIFDSIAKLVEEGRKAIVEKDWVRLGTLMDYNQNYLEDLGVSTDKLNLMITAAKKAGAYGAKLSGAGGGDCMIALVSADSKSNVSKAIAEVGGEIIPIKVNSHGVRVETIN